MALGTTPSSSDASARTAETATTAAVSLLSDKSPRVLHGPLLHPGRCGRYPHLLQPHGWRGWVQRPIQGPDTYTQWMLVVNDSAGQCRRAVTFRNQGEDIKGSSPAFSSSRGRQSITLTPPTWTISVRALGRSYGLGGARVTQRRSRSPPPPALPHYWRGRWSL